MWLIRRKNSQANSSSGRRRGVLGHWFHSPSHQAGREPSPEPTHEDILEDFARLSTTEPLLPDPRTPNRGLRNAPKLKVCSGQRPPKIKDSSDVEFARIEAHMALLKSDLRHTTNKVHAEMSNKRRIGIKFEGMIMAPEHLSSGSFHWDHHIMVCCSPSSIINTSEPWLESALGDLSIDDLFALDYELHALMDDLDILTQWWEENYAQWYSHEAELQKLQRSRTDLRLRHKRMQIYLTRDELSPGTRKPKDLALSQLGEQYKSKTKQLSEVRRWFEKNGLLMNGVVMQFHQLCDAAEVTKSRRAKREDLPFDFSYDWDAVDPPDADHIPPWWKHGTPHWWLTNASKDIDMRWHELNANLEICVSELLQCQIVKKEKQSRLEHLLKKMGLVDQEHQAEGEEQIRKKDIEVLRLKNLLKALDQELKIRDLKGLGLKKRIERIKPLSAFVKDNFHQAQEMETDWVLKGGVPKDNVFHYLYIYIIISLHAFQSDLFDQLQKILNCKDFHYRHKVWILDQVSRHREVFANTHRWVCNLPEIDVLRYTDVVEDAIVLVAREWATLHCIVVDAGKCLKSLEEPTSSPFHPTAMTEDISFDDGQLSGSGVGTAKSGPNTRSVGSDLSILNEKDSRCATKRGTLGETIHGFFVSPDIAPTFQRMVDAPFDQFLRLANSLISTKYRFTPREIEAFLSHCTQLKEMFSLEGQIVNSLEDGWELVDEMPIAGPPRKITPVPPLVDQFGLFLARNQDTLLKGMGLSISGPRRDIRQDDALAVIRRHSPYDLKHGLTDDALLDLLYASIKQGSFFRCFDHGQQRIFRGIDNGWYIDPTLDLPPLFSETNEPKPYFKKLRQLFRSYAMRHGFKVAKANRTPLDTVERLHKYFKPWLYLRQGPSKPVLTISKHKLYLFLRWCSERGDLFSLSRDGKVTKILVGWNRTME